MAAATATKYHTTALANWYCRLLAAVSASAASAAPVAVAVVAAAVPFG